MNRCIYPDISCGTIQQTLNRIITACKNHRCSTLEGAVGGADNPDCHINDAVQGLASGIAAVDVTVDTTAFRSCSNGNEDITNGYGSRYQSENGHSWSFRRTNGHGGGEGDLGGGEGDVAGDGDIGDGVEDGVEQEECCSRLGSDLLQMYRKGEDTDITLRVGTNSYNAHR